MTSSNTPMIKLARKVRLGFAEPPESPKGRAVVENYLGFWENFISRMDADGDGRVTKQEFINTITNKILDEDAFDRVYRPHVQAVAELCDTDDDGTLDRSEYTRLMALYGVSAQDAGEAFDQIDIDHDGHLTVEELTAAARDFYLSDDPNSTGSSLFGRA